MSVPEQNVKVYEDLTWVTYKEENNQSYISKFKSKGIFGILVPLGCLGTCGILATGLYYMFQKNSIKQQYFMRYRVLAQGVTIGLAALGILTMKSS